MYDKNLCKYCNSEADLSALVTDKVKIYKERETYKIYNFQKLCEEILGKKLVKDSKNRISKTTIKSVFQKVYSNIKAGINSSNGSSNSKKDCLMDSVK